MSKKKQDFLGVCKSIAFTWPKKEGIKQNTTQKGFVFTMEAALSLLMLALMVAALPQPAPFSLKELAITQQANDLLRVWSAKSTNEMGMITDTNNLFLGNAELWNNEKKLIFAAAKGNSIATEGIILDDFLVERKIRIVVYYD